MCGISGIVHVESTHGGERDHSPRTVTAMSDALAHRGPDGVGLWTSHDRRVCFGHRRLAVRDLSQAAAQPLTTPDGLGVLIYNGELYNDAEIRARLLEHHAQTGLGPDSFRSNGDAETVLWALRVWGQESLPLLRGMYALAYFDSAPPGPPSVLLARDPLGIKPLVYAATDDGDLVFASEAHALFRHPALTPRPNLAAVSGYLSTIRTTLGAQTLFAGVRMLRPGEVLSIDLSGPGRVRASRTWRSPPVATLPVGVDRAAPTLTAVHSAVAASIAAHLRSDVPTCLLLSGGLDSCIIAAELTALSSDQRAAAGLGGTTRTYCAGHDDGVPASDLAHARRAAAALASRHAEAPITRALFRERWPEMIERLGVPLSTPNEVAINQVARELRRDGCVVTLSGEGADELFGGYDLPLRRAMEVLTHTGAATAGDLAGAHLAATAWTPVAAVGPGGKQELLSPEAWRAAEHDAALIAELIEEVASAAGEAGPAAGPLDVQMRLLRRLNLPTLLQRLDSAAMLEGVEGRTPFADSRVAELAEMLPASVKIDLSAHAEQSGRPCTKLVLRAAFEASLRSLGLADALTRPKASFPLPFQDWLADLAPAALSGGFARDLFTPEAIREVLSDPAGRWSRAWPMVNLALWGRRWGW